MQVTRHNLSQVYADFKRELSKCDFVAMDQEMCGIHKAGKDVFRSQTPVEAWQTPYFAAKTYIAFQCGLCLCRVKRDNNNSTNTGSPTNDNDGMPGSSSDPHSMPPTPSTINNNVSQFTDPQQDINNNNSNSESGSISLSNISNKLELRPYNFWLRQHGRPATDVLLNMDTIDFLARNNMDFNTWLNDGMEFCNTSQADAHRNKILPTSYPPSAKEVGKQFCVYMRKIVEQWFVSCSNSNNSITSSNNNNNNNNNTNQHRNGINGAAPLIDIIDLISTPFTFQDTKKISEKKGDGPKSKNAAKKERRKERNNSNSKQDPLSASGANQQPEEDEEAGAFQDGQKEESSSSATTESPLLHATRRILKMPSSSSNNTNSIITATNKNNSNFDAPDGSFNVVAASPDGLLVAAGDATGNVFIWSYFNLRCVGPSNNIINNGNSNKQQHQQRYPNCLSIPDSISIFKPTVTAICFPPNSMFIAVGYSNSLVAVFEISSSSFTLMQSFWMSRTMQRKSNFISNGTASDYYQQQFVNQQLMMDDSTAVAALQFDKRGLMLTVATTESTLAVWDLIRSAFVVPPLKKKLKLLENQQQQDGSSSSKNRSSNDNDDEENEENDDLDDQQQRRSSQRKQTRSSSDNNKKRRSSSASSTPSILAKNKGAKTSLILSNDGNQLLLCEGNFVRRFRASNMAEISSSTSRDDNNTADKNNSNRRGSSSNSNSSSSAPMDFSENDIGSSATVLDGTTNSSLIFLTDKLISAAGFSSSSSLSSSSPSFPSSSTTTTDNNNTKLNIESSSIVVSPNGKLAAGVIQQPRSSSSSCCVLLVAVWEVNLFATAGTTASSPKKKNGNNNSNDSPKSPNNNDSSNNNNNNCLKVIEIPCQNLMMASNQKHNNTNASSSLSSRNQQQQSIMTMIMKSANVSFSGDNERIAVSLTVSKNLKPQIRGIFNEATSAASTIFMFDLPSGGNLISVLNPEEETSIELVRAARERCQGEGQQSSYSSNNTNQKQQQQQFFLRRPQQVSATANNQQVAFTFFHNKNGHSNIVSCYPTLESAAHKSGISVWELQQQPQKQNNNSNNSGSETIIGDEQTQSSSTTMINPFNGGVVSISQDSITVLLCDNPNPGTELANMLQTDTIFSISQLSSSSSSASSSNASNVNKTSGGKQQKQNQNQQQKQQPPTSPLTQQQQSNNNNFVKLDVAFERKNQIAKLYTYTRKQPGYRDQIIRQRQEELTEKLGFRLFYEALKESGKPLVGHHFVSDLAFFLNQHEFPLREDFAWFKKTANSIFPSVFDTKAIAMRYLNTQQQSNSTPSMCSPGGSSSSVGVSTGAGSQQLLCSSLALEDLYNLRQQDPRTNVDVSLPMPFLSYHSGTTTKIMNNNNNNASSLKAMTINKNQQLAVAHQGAYDAMMTAVVFWSFLFEQKEFLLSEMENAIAFYGINYWMNLGSNYDFLAWCQVVVVEHPSEIFQSLGHISDFLELNCPGVVAAVPGSSVQFIRPGHFFNIVIRPHAQGSVIEEMCTQLEQAGGFKKPSQASGKVSSVSLNAAQAKAGSAATSSSAGNSTSQNNNNSMMSNSNSKKPHQQQHYRLDNNSNNDSFGGSGMMSRIPSTNSGHEQPQQNNSNNNNNNPRASSEKKSRKQKRLENQQLQLQELAGNNDDNSNNDDDDDE